MRKSKKPFSRKTFADFQLRFLLSNLLLPVRNGSVSRDHSLLDISLGGNLSALLENRYFLCYSLMC